MDVGYRMAAALLVCSWSTSSSRFESTDLKRERTCFGRPLILPPAEQRKERPRAQQATARARRHNTRGDNRHNPTKQTLFSSVTSSSGRMSPASAQAERSRQANDRPSWSTPSISSTCWRLLRRVESEDKWRLFSTSALTRTNTFDKSRSGVKLWSFLERQRKRQTKREEQAWRCTKGVKGGREGPKRRAEAMR